MTRITQSQVKIAEAIDSGGPLTATQIAKTYGARVSNARRAADYMTEKGHLMFWDGRYNLTKLGRDDVLLSTAADTLHRERRRAAHKPIDDAPKVDLFTPQKQEEINPADLFTSVQTDEPIIDEPIIEDDFDDIFPIVTAAVIIDIAGHDLVLTVDDAQELRRSLNNFFRGA